MSDISIEIKRLTEGSLPDLLQLQESVFVALERPEMLRRNSEAMLASCLAEPHVALGAWAGGRLVAAAIMYDPSVAPEEDLGHLLKAGEVRGLRCANFKLCMVSPDYRGRGLQQQMGQMLEGESCARGIEALCATVAPDNEASRRSLLKIGYRCGYRVVKYGYERDVYYKVLQASVG